MNTFGTRLRIRLDGASHAPEVRVEIRGLPSGIPIAPREIQAALDRRSPMGRRLASRRREPDQLVVDEGLAEGRTDGGPFRAHVANVDIDRAPYEALRDTPRPGHADFPARVRYGDTADLSGGGMFSGRMTIGLVIAGAVADGLLRPRGIETVAFTRAIGGVTADVPSSADLTTLVGARDASEVACPEPGAGAAMESAILAARRDGDSLGGVVEARSRGIPVGLGEPFFDSIESEAAHLAFAIPAVKGVEFGDGFAAATRHGSEHNDPYDWRDGRVVPRTNHAGGILGGLATGAPIVMRVAVKPTSSIARPQETVNLRTGAPATIVVGGRHDPCIVPRAVVVVESVLKFVLADLGLRGGFWP